MQRSLIRVKSIGTHPASGIFHKPVYDKILKSNYIQDKSVPHIRVRVYPSSISEHVSQIYTGLMELHHEKKILLKFSGELGADLPKLHSNMLWVEISTESRGNMKLTCFDMQDGGQTISQDALASSDIYFKRSYDANFMKQLPGTLSRKVHPYGLNYACRSPHMIKTIERQILYYRVNNLLTDSPVSSAACILRHATGLLLSDRFGIKTSSLPFAPDFVVPPNHPVEKRILFLTRVWEPKGGQEYNALNDMRAETIRALRRHFGDRFIGGLKRMPYAEAHYPDCIATHNTSKANYLALVKQCMIAVTTTGLYRSTGWKLPEYLAASRCIVTESLIHALPSPLLEGRNIISFTNPQQCVEACSRILDDPVLAREMRVNNFDYYNREVKPPVLLYNRINDTIRENQELPS